MMSNFILSGFLLSAFLLCVCFLTPCFAVVAALIELTTLVLTDGSDGFHLCLSIAEACILAALGPGAYSVDARLFGRKLLDIPPRK
jgi:uncharacterized membrane protein YphA (DoxX/SURF4 family)